MFWRSIVRVFKPWEGFKHMQRLLSACVAVAVLSLAGCDHGKVYGRIIGFLVDGTTGKTLNVFSASGINNEGNDGNATNDVYALIEGSFKRAEPCGEGDANKTNGIPADGCYRFEGVPTDTAIQIFAQYTGYEKFQGQTTVTTTAATTTDIPDADPQVIANIQLFPVGFSLDYHVLVTGTDAAPVQGVTVSCQHTDVDYLNTAGTDFVQPEFTTTAAISATTDSTGSATIPGASLVNGGSYHCYVVPTGAGAVDENDDFTFTAGSSDTQIQINVGNDVGLALYALSSNVDSTTALAGNATSLVITLNVPAEIVPGTQDCQTAVLTDPDTNHSGNTPPTLPTNVPNDTAGSVNPETMTASLSADGLTLTLNVKGLSGSFDPNDTGTSVSYNGVFLRAKNDASEAKHFFSIGSTSPSASYGCTVGTSSGSLSALHNDHIDGVQSSVVDLY